MKRTGGLGGGGGGMGAREGTEGGKEGERKRDGGGCLIHTLMERTSEGMHSHPHTKVNLQLPSTF